MTQPAAPADRAMVQNVSRYPLFAAAFNAYAWLPIFFLYFSSRVTVTEVLLLEALYYAAVVVLEVPSGYFSDRVGRRTTLVLASLGLLIAYAIFAVGSSFWVLGTAQVFLAAGLAFNSGTDTSFHLDSLTAAGLGGEYAAREANVSRVVFAAGAVAALAGGAAAVLDLRAAYLLSAVGAVIALVVALSFREPPREGPADAGTDFAATLRECLTKVGSRPLVWFFGVSVLATVINHVPYEFYQPYLDNVGFSTDAWSARWTPLLAGLHVTLAQLIASPVAGRSVAMARRLGIQRYLLLTLVLQVGIVLLMSAFLHPIIAIVLVARSVPRALQAAPINAEVAPRVRSGLRATYLSIQSLVGRLSYASFLAMLAFAFDAEEPTWEVLSSMLPFGAVVGGGGILLLVMGWRAGRAG